MKPLIICSALLIAASVAQAEEGFHSVQAKGYKGLPQIAGTDFTVHQPDRPQPPRVIPGRFEAQQIPAPPSDALILFDGTSLNQFQESKWNIEQGYIVAGEGPLFTKGSFGNFQLHVEWRTPTSASDKAVNMGNSGLYIMQRYELQVFDSYTCKIYADGSAAAIYGQTPPLVNVCRKPGEWQTFDVYFTAPAFAGDKLVTPAYITVLHNGVFVHNKTEIKGPTSHLKFTPYKPHQPRLPIMFQGHSSPVEYRNIWIRDLNH